MKKENLKNLHNQFEGIVQIEEGEGTEFWLARDLQEILEYSEWRNFDTVIRKAKVACEKAGHEIHDHFVDVNKMVDIGSGATREIRDIALTRYACYLIAQNGDPSKDPIAYAQTYFAVQTRKQELIDKRIAELERLKARKKLSESEKELSGIIFERLGDGQSFARIRSKGDRELFGGLTTKKMKSRLGVPDNRPLADFLPTITIKAKDFANEITNFNINRDDLNSEHEITKEHKKSNRSVRQALTDHGIDPEYLPPEEDVKKVARRLESEKLGLPKKNKKFEISD